MDWLGPLVTLGVEVAKIIAAQVASPDPAQAHSDLLAAVDRYHVGHAASDLKLADNDQKADEKLSR